MLIENIDALIEKHQDLVETSQNVIRDLLEAKKIAARVDGLNTAQLRALLEHGKPLRDRVDALQDEVRTVRDADSPVLRETIGVADIGRTR